MFKSICFLSRLESLNVIWKFKCLLNKFIKLFLSYSSLSYASIKVLISPTNALVIPLLVFIQSESKKTIEIGNYDLKNSVVASDAFLPFPDTLEHIHKAGAIAIIQPGGSKKDSEIIELANKLNISMIFSSVRNFNH